LSAPQQPDELDGLHAQAVEHADRCGVDAGAERRLHAARQQQHAARVQGLRNPSGCAARRHLGLQRGGQQRPRQAPQRQRRREQRRAQALGQQPTLPAQPGRARCGLLFGQVAADLGDLPVLHAARAGGLAGAAGQAGVEVGARAVGRALLALEQLLDQVDAAARAVQFVAQHLIARAGGGAEAAVHAGLDERLSALRLGVALEGWGQLGVHGPHGSQWPARFGCQAARPA
jgi:hypothetical protein